MLRILIFVLSVIFAAGVVTVLAGADGWTRIEAFGLKFDVHTGFGAGVLFAVFLASLYLMSTYKDIRRLAGEVKAKEAESRRTRGIQALTRGLEAVAVGDADSAQHHARVARRNLDQSALTRLLTAQAAQLAGDKTTARENFTLMLEAPETEFLGLRGLYQQAIREGDEASARVHAERAFRLRPNARWAFESIVSLGLARGAWGDVRAALTVAQKNKIVDPQSARRGEAALLTAGAYASEASGDVIHALQEVEAAIKLAPSFAPAAVLGAKLHDDAGRRSRGARILEQAFAEAAHPSLISAHNKLFETEPEDKRAEQMKRIADRRPSSRDAKLQFARRHLLLSEFSDAVTVLEPLLRETVTASEAAMMAEAVGGAWPGEAGANASREWLRRAAGARRVSAPGADGVFHFTREGWARLIREYMDCGRLAPPPLEDVPPGISEQELQLLAPPLNVDQQADEVAMGANPPSDAPLLDDEGTDRPDAAGARAVAAAGEIS